MAKKGNLLPLVALALPALVVFLVGGTPLGVGRAEAAIAFRAAAQAGGGTSAAPTFQAAGTAQAGAGALTVAWPTHQANDIGLLVIETANQAVTLGTNAGDWTPVTNSPQGTGTAGGTAATQLAVFWSRATSSTMGSVGINDSGNHERAQILTFRGVITSGNPWDVTAGNVAATASTAVSIPGATTTVENTLVVAIVANGTDTTTGQTSGWTNANLTGLTEQADGNASNGNGGGFGVATGVMATAGAYGATTATLATSSVQGLMSIALRPPPPTLTIAMPTGTVQNDVMIASIAFRANSGSLSSDIGITPPAGWVLVRRMDNPNTTYNGLVVYYRVAGSSESGSYQWTFSCSATCSTYGFQAAAGGIVSFSGVDTANPINVENGQNTPASYNLFTPNVTTTVANAMLVTSHAVANADTWQSSPPSGMTQAFQVTSGTEAIQVSWALQAATGPTGQKQATDLGPDAADSGNAHILALWPPVCGAISDASYVAADAQATQAIVYWASSNPALILRKNGSAITDAPADGGSYSVGNTIGSSSVVYNGSVAETSFTQTGLTNGTTYYYKVFPKSGTCYAPGISVTARPAAGPDPAWSYMMANGSTMRGGVAGQGSVNTAGNFARIISLNTADGTQMWTPLATTAAVQGWLTWLPNSYPYRQPLTVTAGSTAVPSGYSVPVTINHASLVSAGKSLANGDDLRVFYWTGTAWVQLDRVLDEASAWNSATTTVWFQTQAAIAASGTDSNYYLFYGNPNVGAPPANPSNVYIFYDDFNWSDAPSNHGWTVRNGTWAAAGGVMTSSGTATSFGVLSHAANTTGAVIEARVRGRADVCADCRHTGVGLRFSSAGSGYVGIGYDYGSTELSIVGQTGWQTNNTLLAQIAQTLASDTWHRVKFQAIGTTLSDKAWVDGTAEPGWQVTVTDGTYASGTQIALFGGWASPKHSEFDWLKVRSAVSPEPTTGLGTEQATTAGVVIGGDQSGRVYAVDATSGGLNWSVTLTGADAVQAPVAAQLQQWSNASFKAAYSDDVLFAATRNSSATTNKLFALKATDGTVLWSFNGTVSPNNMDYIVGMPWVDYTRNRVYVVSRSNSGTQPSLWVINSLSGALVTSFSLGDIEASPTLSGDGNTLYVATTSGNLYAISTSGTPGYKWTGAHYTALGTAVQGFIWENADIPGRLYFSSSNGYVWSLQDPGAGVAPPNPATPVWKTAVASPSTPLPMDKLYVGSSDGKVHQLNLTSGVDEKQFTVGGGAYQVGDVSSETGSEIFVPTTEGTLYKLPVPLP
jgi:hypothetical protein